MYGVEILDGVHKIKMQYLQVCAEINCIQGKATSTGNVYYARRSTRDKSESDRVGKAAAKVHDLEKEAAEIYEKYLDALDQAEELCKKIDCLDEQTVVLCCCVYGKRVEDIAEAMKISLAQAYKLRSRGIKRLQEISAAAAGSRTPEKDTSKTS